MLRGSIRRSIFGTGSIYETINQDADDDRSTELPLLSPNLILHDATNDKNPYTDRRPSEHGAFARLGLETLAETEYEGASPSLTLEEDTRYVDNDEEMGRPSSSEPTWKPAVADIPVTNREIALWRWLNIENLDDFLTQVRMVASGRSS